MKKQKENSHEGITWSEMGKQNVQAEKVYCVKRLTDCCRCVGASACDNPSAILLLSWPLTSPGMECLLLIVNIELSIDYISRVNRLFAFVT